MELMRFKILVDTTQQIKLLILIYFTCYAVFAQNFFIVNRDRILNLKPLMCKIFKLMHCIIYCKLSGAHRGYF